MTPDKANIDFTKGLKVAKTAVNTLAGATSNPSGPSTSTGNRTNNVWRIFSPGNNDTPTNSRNDSPGMGTAACIAVVGGAIAAGAAAGYCAATYASGQDRRQADGPNMAVSMVEIATEELYTSEVKETTTTQADGSTTTKKTSKRRTERREKRAVRQQPQHAQQPEAEPGVPPRAREAEVRRRMAVALMGQG